MLLVDVTEMGYEPISEGVNPTLWDTLGLRVGEEEKEIFAFIRCFPFSFG